MKSGFLFIMRCVFGVWGRVDFACLHSLVMTFCCMKIMGSAWYKDWNSLGKIVVAQVYEVWLDSSELVYSYL
ncbi:unnamed protein product [Lathyrus sativus]|nr:unnamed protein product [Lathyrus sativus]